MTDAGSAPTISECDLLVIGGGINGAGIARDAAGRGLRVVLCEQHDFAAGTSSASSKLVHGGLRYLEHYEFGLVRQSLLERETLLGIAPHIIWPLRFVLPHVRGMRPAWMIRLGLLLYDLLAGRSRLPRTRRVTLARHAAGACLDGAYITAFEYSDCWVDDARLVIVNLLDAAERGATVLRDTRFTGARRREAGWEVDTEEAGGERRRFRARALVNAAGPWVSEVGNGVELRRRETPRVRQVKGSHVVVPRLDDAGYAFTLQAEDRRVIFVIPFGERYSLIGTTETTVDSPALPQIDPEECAYLCRSVSRCLRRPISVEDVVWSYSGVRPLQDEGDEDISGASRDYRIVRSGAAGEAPLITVVGGKLTTYRRLAERVLAVLGDGAGRAPGPAWTGAVPLPGGELPDGDFDAFRDAMCARWPELPRALLSRLLRAYGTRTERILERAGGVDSLGHHFGNGLYEAEVRYLCEHEWARSAEDILWRRTKTGIGLAPEGREALVAWLARRDAGCAPPVTGSAR